MLLWRRWLDARVKQRGEVETATMTWLFDRDPGGAGHLCSPLRLRLLKRILGVELCGGCGVAPVRRRERWSPTAEAATAWQSTSGPDPMLFTLLGAAFGCSGIAAKDPAWRRPSWCGVVHLFVSFSTLGHTEGFSMIIRVWSADGCCDLFRLCCRFVWGGYL